MTGISKADRFSPTLKKVENFSDFLNNFDRHPLHDTLAKVTNEEAVKQALRNLILTNIGERLFQPTVGSDVYKALFEPNDVVTAENIVFFVKNAIKQNEPRVNLLTVHVYPDPDTNSFDVNILFSLINNPTPISLNLILRRVR